MMLLLGIAVPFLVGSAHVIRNAPERAAEDPSFLRTYRFIFSKYRNECYSFHMYFLLRQFLIALMPAVTPTETPEVGAVGLLCVVCFFLAIQTYKWPWRVDDMNYLDCTMACLMVLFLGCGLGLQAGPDETIEMAVRFLAGVWMASLAGVLVKHGYLAAQWRGGFQQDPQIEQNVCQTAREWQTVLEKLAHCDEEDHKKLFAEWAWYDLHALQRLVNFLVRDYGITGLGESCPGKRIILETSPTHAGVRTRVHSMSLDQSLERSQRKSLQAQGKAAELPALLSQQEGVGKGKTPQEAAV